MILILALLSACGPGNADEDGDGVSVADGDCDDTEAKIHPGARDVPYDGLDTDCGGGSDDDADGDGADDAAHGGDDCDDADPTVYPGAGEDWQDDVDQDCDGVADVEGAACEADIDLVSADGARVALDLCGAWSMDASFDVAAGELRTFELTLPSSDSESCRITLAMPGVCGAGTYLLGDDAGALEVVAVTCEGVGAPEASTWSAVNGYVQLDAASPGGGALAVGGATAVNLSGELRGLAGDGRSLEGSFAISGTVVVVPAADDLCAPLIELDADGDGDIALAYGGTDCDDAEATVNPGAPEVCGGLDDDCDGLVDLDDPSVDPDSYIPWHRDLDGDGYGDPDATVEACSAPDGYVLDGTDCDDQDAAVSPAAVEVCDAADVDEDCDSLTDDADPDADSATASIWYLDLDGDGYGDPADAGVLACDPAGLRSAPDATDCDDTDAVAHPSAAEVCDTANTDEDCDGLSDDEDRSVASAGFSTWYVDTDGDSYGGTSSARACDATGTYTATSLGDCDDADAAVNPGASEVCDAADADEDCDGTVDDDDRSLDTSTTSALYRDADGDGWAPTGAASLSLCDPSGLYAATTMGDCDDADDAVSPGAVETCDAADTDEDCDGFADDDDTTATGTTTWYIDLDGDGSGASTSTTSACDAAGTYTARAAGDCDDADATVSPSATEVCDTADVDEDCDGLADDADAGVSAASKGTWYRDADADGYGDSARAGVLACDAASTYTATVNTDCDDARATISPAAAEVCDAADTDEDCDGRSDDADVSVSAATKTRYYADADRDGYGRSTDAGALACDATSSRSATAATDCDDARSAVNPAAVEVCDSSDADEDCDGAADDADASVSTSTYGTWYADADRDSYGNAAVSTRACNASASYRVADATDCDDTRSSVNPGRAETWYDGTDGDCDGLSDDDQDVDGYDAAAWGGDDCDDTDDAVNPAATEIWYDGVDGDCDGLSDYDQDLDGYEAESYGGDDCLDTDADAWPGNAEAWYDGIDGDCDGASDYDQDLDGYTSDAYGGTDCDDTSALAYPSAAESWFDATDSSCDGYDERVSLRSADTVISGAAVNYQSGFPRTGGDLDGDGYDDLVVASANGTGTYGSHSVLYGPITGDVSLSSVTDVINVNTGTGAGYIGAIVRDTDGDGNDDYLIGENGGFMQSSYAYLLRGPITGSKTVASAVTLSAGLGSRRGGYYLGQSVADGGDVDGDGYGDFVVGAPWGDYGCTSFEERGYQDFHCGDAFVFYGPVTSNIAVDSSGADAVLVGTRATTDLSLNEQIGIAVTGAGDLDGDGYDDVGVAGTLADYTGTDSGVVWIHLGPLSGSVAVTTGDASVRGDSAGDQLGTSLSVQGDLDGDGYSDLVVGAPYADEGGANAGAAYVFYGSIAGTNGAASADLVLYGAEAGDLAGSEVSFVENIDGAGANAVVVSAPYNDLIATSSGAVYVLTSPGIGTFYLDDAAAALFTGRNTSDLAGSPARASDLDGDGAGDVVIGVYADDQVDTNAGAVFIHYGDR
jgi:hypothetical protein